MRAITADYQERIIIGPEDVIPRSSWFRFVKCSLVAALSMLVTLAVITLIVAESFVSNDRAGLATGIVSLVGIILFLIGIIAVLKEHIPLVLSFSVAMILYLLLFMYSRVITSPGLIILRTFILLLLAIEAFCFCIMIRDWRAIQVSRLNQRMMKEAAMAQYQMAVNNGGGMMMHNINISGGYAGQPGSSQQQHMYAYSSAGGGQLMSGGRQQMFQQNRGGYPDEMRPYQTPVTGRRSVPPYGSSALSPNQQQYNRGGHQHHQMNYSGNVYSQQQQQHLQHQHHQQQYGPHSQYDLPNHHQPNPYITIEDENPYAQIGEPTTMSGNTSRRGLNQNQGHVYTTQGRQASQPARRY